MSFVAIDTNKLVHHGSPYYLGVALHTWSIAQKPPVDGPFSLGVVKTKLRNGGITAFARLSVALAVDEEVQIDIIVSHVDGSEMILFSHLLTQASGAGETDMTGSWSNSIIPEPGDHVSGEVTYTSGGGPNEPRMSLSFQMG